MKRMKKESIKFYPMKNVEYVENNGFLFQWCCDCHLRHIWQFEIVTQGKKQFIKINGIDDRMGTKLRKFYLAHH